jgi:hypothetical protein
MRVLILSASIAAALLLTGCPAPGGGGGGSAIIPGLSLPPGAVAVPIEDDPMVEPGKLEIIAFTYDGTLQQLADYFAGHSTFSGWTRSDEPSHSGTPQTRFEQPDGSVSMTVSADQGTAGVPKDSKAFRLYIAKISPP